MIRIDEGRRFSDDTYASKEDVKAAYNQDNVDVVWDKILSYRSYFDCESDLSDTNGNHYKICLTKKILATCYPLEISLVKMYADYASLFNEYRNAFALNQLVKAMSATAHFANINVSENTITKIAKGEIENLSNSLFPLKAYQNAYCYALANDHFDLQVMENINKLLIGQELDSDVTYRKSEVTNIVNPLIAPAVKDIPSHLNNLFSFLEQKDIPAILKALGIIYTFSYLRPFEYSNEETAGLCAKAFLNVQNMALPGFSLSLESLAYTISFAYFKHLKESEDTLDLTYYCQAVLPFLEFCRNKMAKELHDVQLKQEEALQSPTLQNDKQSDDYASPLNGSTSFALPDFPISSDETKIEVLAKKLLEVHPHLKKKQAHFYAGHCQIGLHYTIEQFKKEEHTVYETARTSMENLANRGFYKKELIGKKFVYTPIPIKD